MTRNGPKKTLIFMDVQKCMSLLGFVEVVFYFVPWDGICLLVPSLLCKSKFGLSTWLFKGELQAWRLTLLLNMTVWNSYFLSQYGNFWGIYSSNFRGLPFFPKPTFRWVSSFFLSKRKNLSRWCIWFYSNACGSFVCVCVFLTIVNRRENDKTCNNQQ